MGDDDYDDDDHDAVIIVPQTELVAIRFWLRYIYIWVPVPLFPFSGKASNASKASKASNARKASNASKASKANHY